MSLLDPDSIAVALPSVEEQAPVAPPSPLADLEHPWLGLESFREETRAYFFGRDVEVAEIDLRLRSHPLLVLYGRSGLGKTSILSAGLIPRLTRAGHRPAIHRFDYSNKRVGPAGQMLLLLFISPQSKDEWRYESALSRARQWATELREKLVFDLPPDSASWLWLRLHWSRQPPTTTHLILDQFEEVFTLGAQQPGTEHELRDALAILLQRMIPAPISQLIAKHDNFLDQFDTDSMPVRVILSLRDDYVYALDRWKSHIALLGQNNFELGALGGPAAFDAVFKPGELRCHYRGEVREENKAETGLPPIVDEETAQRIVRFVAEKGQNIPIEEIEAVPPILSLLCRELNERRFTEPAGTPEASASQVVFSETDADVETIIKSFYERCLAGRPEAVRMFIEEDFVSYSGARLAQDEKSILRCFEEGWEIPRSDHQRAGGFGDPVKARECLIELVQQRLITSLGGGENPSYELIHDLVASVAEKSRTARQERYEKEQADLRAETEKKAKNEAEARARIDRERAATLNVALQKEKQARADANRATRRARRMVIAVTVALIAAVFAATYSFVQYSNAKAAKRDADGLIRFMQYDLSERLSKVGRLDMMTSINARIRKYHEDHPPEASDLRALREEGVSLSQQGDLLMAQGDVAGALKSYRDSVTIAERLTKQDPGNASWPLDLSFSYIRVGSVLRAQGDLGGALKSYRDSLTIAERLTKQDPGNASWQRDLSLSYIRVGDVLRDQGDLGGALKGYRDSLGIAEKLTKQHPSDASWQSDLSASYNRVGDVIDVQGDLGGALKSYRDGLAIAEKLTGQDPGNASWQRDLSFSYIRVGSVLRAQGDLGGALKSYRDSLTIAERLTKQDPGNASWQRDLSFSYIRVGDVLRDQGDLGGALKSYRDSLGIAEKLTKQDPGNASWQRDLSSSYIGIGGVLRDQGDLDGALKSYRDSLAIRERLAKQGSGNAGWQSDLSDSFEKIGKVLRDRGDLTSALRSYQETLAIRQQLVRQDASNAGWQWDLSENYDDIGDTLSAQGDWNGGLKNYRNGVAIREKLATQDLINARWQADLAHSYVHVGIGWAKVAPADEKQAQAMVEKGRDILRDLKKRNALTAEQQKWLAEIETEIGTPKKAR